MVDLGRYKWYQSQTLANVPTMRLSPEGGWTRGGVPVRMLDPKEGWIARVPHRLENGTSANEDAGPEVGWIVRSHIDWGGERNTLYKGVETFP